MEILYKICKAVEFVTEVALIVFGLLALIAIVLSTYVV